MNQITKFQKFPPKLNHFLLVLLITVLPFGFLWFFIALVGLALITFFTKGSFINFNDNFKGEYRRYTILNIIYYSIFILGLLWASNKQESLHSLQIKISILVIPLFLALFDREYLTQNKRKILLFFVLGVILATIYSLFQAFSLAIQTNETGELILKLSPWTDMQDKGLMELIRLRTTYFSYAFLSPNKLHVSYYALFINFAISILWIELKYFFRNKKYKLLIIYSLVAIYLSIFIYLLQSRAGLLFLSLQILFFIVESFWQLKNHRKTILGIGIFTLLGLIFILYNSNFKRDFNPTQLHDKRVVIWSSSIKLMKEKPILGYGTGNQKQVLKNKLNQVHPELAEEHHNRQYNDPHNQFFADTLQLGIMGGFAILAWLIYLISVSFKYKNSLLFYLILNIIVNITFESMFERTYGLTFMLLFISLLIISQKELETI